MDLQRLAKLERLHNKLEASVREHFAKFTEDEILRDAYEMVNDQPLLALVYMEEVLRRFETETMNECER